VSHIRALVRTEHFRRLWKYASVSVVSTLTTQVVLFLTYHVWNVGPAVECNVIATVVASVPAYYLNRSWTWGKKGRSNIWSEVVPFWTIALIAMVLSTVAVGVAAHNADRIAHGSLERALIVNGANLITYAILWTARYFVLNRYLFGSRAAKSASGAVFEALVEVLGEPAAAAIVETATEPCPEPEPSGLTKAESDPAP
jgi:putative flippase GtrA